MPRVDRVESVFAFLYHDDDGEQVAELLINAMPVPLMGTRDVELATMEAWAQQQANALNRPLTLAFFSTRDDVRVVHPHATDAGRAQRRRARG